MKRLKVPAILDIYRRYREQENVADIAASHGISTAHVYRIGRGVYHTDVTGHKPRAGRRQRLKLPDNLVELYSRYSLESIAIEFGVKRRTVKAELLDRGVKLRNSTEAARLSVRNRGKYGQIYETS